MIKLKTLLLEYINEPISILKRYLTQTKEEQKTEIGLEQDCLEYLGIYHPAIYEKYRKNNYGESSELLMREYPDIFKQWCEFLYKKHRSDDIFVNGYPTWNYVSYESIVKNQWLIHFSDDAQYIALEQKFSLGVYDYTRLGLTTHLPESEKEGGGYNFAYLLSDYKRYGKERSRWKYGKEAVLFKASGVKVWHYGDQEPQVIFWGPSAFDIVCIREDKNTGDYYVYTANAKYNSPFSGDFDECVDWITNNFNQYKRVLLP